MNNAKVQSVIESVFSLAIEKLGKDGVANVVSDLYVQLDFETGELQIYGDDNLLLEKIVVFDWLNASFEDEEAFNNEAIAAIKVALANLSSKGLFEHPCVLKPFSVSLVDEDFTILEELLFLDDELLRLDDPLLKNLDEDLDDFLDKLLSDVK
ncbi:hypothetical protein [Parabacteroides sp. Marseille-P3160]|uniref:hypothetical protein n=1 Tax=Parabacteroides sp. Marseille-P3160 TaxID=1917887 RepID=UPI0009BA3D8C|nr:hypothetical protein [Parabacteroides sp. Marseille-P3160]